MVKRVLIFGAKGMLGLELVDALSKDSRFQVHACDQKCADIADLSSVTKAVRKYHPDFIINSAAKIDVVECEERDPLGAWLTNTIGPGNITHAINRLGFKKTIFIQISTSDIFGGIKQKFFKEDDLPYPANTYGWTKLGGEKLVEKEAKISGLKYFIARTSWIYSKYKDTFVDFIAKAVIENKEVKAVADQYNIPIWAKDIARGVISLMNQSARHESGVYHLADNVNKLVSRYDIARYIAKLVGGSPRLIKRVYRRNFFHIPRPWSSTLVNTKKVPMPDWQKSLRQYIAEKYGASYLKKAR